jgi:hypothetical protein
MHSASSLVGNGRNATTNRSATHESDHEEARRVARDPAPAVKLGSGEIRELADRIGTSSTALTSSDSVTHVGNFYKDALAKGGWQITSSSGSAYNASFTAHRANKGVSISVYSRGAASGISITTPPGMIETAAGGAIMAGPPVLDVGQSVQGADHTWSMVGAHLTVDLCPRG